MKYKISKREIQVLELISIGLSTREIGAELHISPLTAQTHRKNILGKLEAHNAASVVRIGFELGYLSFSSRKDQKDQFLHKSNGLRVAI